MSSTQTLQELEDLRSRLLGKHLPTAVLEKLRGIESTISLLRELGNGQIPQGNAPTNQKIVVDAALELIEMVKGRNVTNGEILDFLLEKGISIDMWKDRDSGLASILYTEHKKKHGRLRKAGRGLWNIRREKHPFSRRMGIVGAGAHLPEEAHRMGKQPDPDSKHSIIISETVGLGKSLGRPITLDEIVQAVENKGIVFLGKTGKRTTIAGILSREERLRKNPKIKKIGVATYDLA